MRGFNLLVLSVFLTVGSLFAAEVKLKDGTAYHDVRILERTDQYLRITVPYGEMKLPISKVESIDGVAIEEPMLAPTPAPSPVPATDEKAQEPKETTPPPAPPYIHRWTMDIFLLVMGLAMMSWISALLWVQLDVKGMPEEIKRANADVLLLPFLGFLMYLIDRHRQ